MSSLGTSKRNARGLSLQMTNQSKYMTTQSSPKLPQYQQRADLMTMQRPSLRTFDSSKVQSMQLRSGDDSVRHAHTTAGMLSERAGFSPHESATILPLKIKTGNYTTTVTKDNHNLTEICEKNEHLRKLSSANYNKRVTQQPQGPPTGVELRNNLRNQPNLTSNDCFDRQL